MGLAFGDTMAGLCPRPNPPHRPPATDPRRSRVVAPTAHRRVCGQRDRRLRRPRPIGPEPDGDLPRRESARRGHRGPHPRQTTGPVGRKCIGVPGASKTPARWPTWATPSPRLDRFQGRRGPRHAHPSTTSSSRSTGRIRAHGQRPFRRSGAGCGFELTCLRGDGPGLDPGPGGPEPPRRARPRPSRGRFPVELDPEETRKVADLTGQVIGSGSATPPTSRRPSRAGDRVVPGRRPGGDDGAGRLPAGCPPADRGDPAVDLLRATGRDRLDGVGGLDRPGHREVSGSPRGPGEADGVSAAGRGPGPAPPPGRRPDRGPQRPPGGPHRL